MTILSLHSQITVALEGNNETSLLQAGNDGIMDYAFALRFTLPEDFDSSSIVSSAVLNIYMRNEYAYSNYKLKVALPATTTQALPTSLNNINSTTLGSQFKTIGVGPSLDHQLTSSLQWFQIDIKDMIDEAKSANRLNNGFIAIFFRPDPYLDSSYCTATGKGWPNVPYLDVTYSQPSPPPEDVPINLVATPISDSEIDLSWEYDDDEVTFDIERNVGGSWSTVETGVEGLTYSDSGLNANTVYSYRVRATNMSGSSDWSDIANAKTFIDTEQEIIIYKDYSTGDLEDHNEDIVSLNNYVYRFLTGPSTSTYIIGGTNSTYDFYYLPPEIYPYSVTLLFNGEDPLSNWDISLSLNDVLVGHRNDVTLDDDVDGYQYALTFILTNQQIKDIFSKPFYRGSIHIGSQIKIYSFDLIFKGDTKTIKNSEIPISSPVIVYPDYVEAISKLPIVSDFSLSSGSSIKDIISIPTSDPNVDDTYLEIIEDNYPSITDNFLRIRFERIDEDQLSSVCKIVLRVRATSPSFDETNNYRALFNCIVMPKVINTNPITLIKKHPFSGDSNFIFRGLANEVVTDDGYQNYDIDLSFVDPFNLDEDGFNFKKNFDSVALINNSDFILYGFCPDLRISSVELIVYKDVDNHLPLFTKAGVEFKEGQSKHFDALSNPSLFNNTVYTEGLYNQLFNAGYYDFRELSGPQVKDIANTNSLNYFNGSNLDNFNWFSRFKGNQDDYVYKNAIYVNPHNNSYVSFNSQPNLSNEFVYYLNISASGFSRRYSPYDESLILYHGSELDNEVEIYHSPSSSKYYCNIYEKNGNIRTLEVNSVSSDKNQDLILQCTKNQNNPNLYDFTFYNITNSFNIDFISGVDRVSYPTAKTYLFGAPNNRSIYSGSYGFINGFGVSTSGWYTNYQKFYESRKNIGNRLKDGQDYTHLKCDGATRNINFGGNFIASALNNDQQNLFQMDLSDYAYNQIKSNPSGFAVEHTFDNLSNREILISGLYRASNTKGEILSLHYSGVIPSGLNQVVKLHPHTSFFSNINRENYSTDVLQTNFYTEGSGIYNLDLKWKRAGITFDAWMTPVTGFDSLELVTVGGNHKDVDFYLHNSLDSLDVDFYLSAKELQSQSVDFYTEAGLLNEDIDFYIEASELENENFPLFLNSAEDIDKDLDFYINSKYLSYDRLNLSMIGGTQPSKNSNINFLTKGGTGEYKVLDFYLNCELDRDNSFPMFIKSESRGSEEFPMFVNQNNNISNIINFVVQNNHSSHNREIPMFIEAPGSGEQSIFNMCIQRVEGVSDIVPFASFAKDMSQEEISFFMNSATLVSGEDLKFYITGSGMDGTPINLYSHGF